MEANGVVRALIRDRAKLLGYIWAIVRDPHTADDIFQDVTVLAIERAAEISGEEHLMLWSRKAARFKALEVLRSKPYRMACLDNKVLDALEADWRRVDSRVIADEAAFLKTCVERLTPRAREILHLRFTEGLTGIQVAELVNVKVSSLYVSLSRIYQALERCIQEQRAKAGMANG